jgi:hypothetical protein
MAVMLLVVFRKSKKFVEKFKFYLWKLRLAGIEPRLNASESELHLWVIIISSPPQARRRDNKVV